jgi:hypothetical protein
MRAKEDEMPELWEVVLIVMNAYACAVCLSYWQWLSDDSNFDPTYKPFGDD